MSKYHIIATRYDSGLTVDYTCDSCGKRQRSMGTPSGWTEDDKTHGCPNCASGGYLSSDLFRGMTVQQGAEAAMATLSADDLEYASDPARGEYRGFAALHDLMDANMILPFVDDVDDDENDRYLRWCNSVMDEVTRRIISR